MREASVTSFETPQYETQSLPIMPQFLGSNCITSHFYFAKDDSSILFQRKNIKILRIE